MMWIIGLALSAAVAVCNAAAVVQCPLCLDVVIILDRSSSIGEWRWERKMLPFVTQFAMSPLWSIGTTDNDYQVAVVSFGTNNTLEWNWGDAQTDNPASLVYAIGGLPHDGGLTNTGAAMTVARTQVIDGPNNRPQCGDVCVVITDGGTNAGEHTDLFEDEIDQFKQACGLVIAIGVTTTVPSDQLSTIASGPGYRIAVESFMQLEAIFPSIVDMLCPPHCPECLDVLMIVDASGSIGRWRWERKVLTFLEKFAISNFWTIGTGPTDYQVSMVTFSTEVDVGWIWGDTQSDNVGTLIDGIYDDLEYSGKLTNTGAGLRSGRLDVLTNTNSNNRPECADVCIVITDGATNPGEHTTTFDQEVGPFRAACNQVIAVGVTTTVPLEKLDAIASRSDFVIQVESFSELETHFHDIAYRICNPQPVCPDCLDVVLILDSSASIGSTTWTNDVIPFLRMFALTSQWTIGSGSNDYQIGIVKFSTDATLQWDWDDVRATDQSALLNAISLLGYEGGVTNTGAALEIARLQVIGGPNNRPQCADVCVVVTDGGTNPGPNTAKFDAEIAPFKAACNRVIVVGVTSSVPQSLLNAIAPVQHQVKVEQFSQLTASFFEVAANFCD